MLVGRAPEAGGWGDGGNSHSGGLGSRELAFKPRVEYAEPPGLLRTHHSLPSGWELGSTKPSPTPEAERHLRVRKQNGAFLTGQRLGLGKGSSTQPAGGLPDGRAQKGWENPPGKGLAGRGA